MYALFDSYVAKGGIIVGFAYLVPNWENPRWRPDVAVFVSCGVPLFLKDFSTR